MNNLTPITAAIDLFKNVSGILKPIIVSFSVLVGGGNAAEIRNNPLFETLSIQHKTDNLDELTSALTQLIIEQVNSVLPLLDTVIYLMPMMAEHLHQEEIDIFNHEFKQSQSMMNKLSRSNNQLTKSIELFNDKLVQIQDALNSSQYKQKFDEVVSERVYQGEESVGYRFDKAHSFDDFKKALLG